MFTKKHVLQYLTTRNSNKINQTITYNIKNQRCTDGHYYNKQQNVTNNNTNHINKKNMTSTNEHVSGFEKGCTTKDYHNNTQKPHAYHNGNDPRKRN